MRDSQKVYESKMSESIVQVTTSKDALAIMGASDDRELLSQGLDDFLPYDIAFEVLVDVLECKAKRNYDNRGVFVSIKILETSAPKEIPVGKTYTQAYFDVHKSMPAFVVAKMLQSRRELVACIAGVPCDDEFKAAPVLLQLHQEVEPLHIKMRFKNVFIRNTRTGKAIHELKYELAQG